MGRIKGSLSKDHADKREALLLKLREHVERGNAIGLGLRNIAEVMGVTVPTVRHYFGSRRGAIQALMQTYMREGEPHMAIMREPVGNFPESIRAATDFLIKGFEMSPLPQIHSFGLAEGFSDQELADSYVRDLLESALSAIGDRLKVHMERGEMMKLDPRIAAIYFISPILMSFLHQCGLNGRNTYPTDLRALAEGHAEAFIRAYQIVKA
jgi:AcrR family transcriptional regulator